MNRDIDSATDVPTEVAIPCAIARMLEKVGGRSGKHRIEVTPPADGGEIIVCLYRQRL